MVSENALYGNKQQIITQRNFPVNYHYLKETGRVNCRVSSLIAQKILIACINIYLHTHVLTSPALSCI